MLIRMLTDSFGQYSRRYNGQEYDMSDREAMVLIKAGQAEVVEPEEMVAETRETAVLKPLNKHNKGGRNERTFHRA